MDHLEKFKTLMLLHGPIEGILYWAFPSTIRKLTCYWYSSLKPNAIHSFDQLNRCFVSYFVSHRRLRRGSNSLINIMQWDLESLQSYVSQFNEVLLEVYNMDHAITIIAMKYGSNSILFYSPWKNG